MKSRTSFCNGPVLRKNLARFAPLWGGYTVCLLLGIVLMVAGDLKFWFAANIGSMYAGMSVINLGYALLTALILFGDLYNTRMCYGFHAMPLRRECWFNTHVISGLIFSVLPTLVMSAICEVLLLRYSVVVDAWQIPLYFLAAANLEYLFFFGLAVLCAMLAGSRVGMALLYGIMNFLSYLVYFLADTLVRPLYYGTVTPEELYRLFCPVAQICNQPLMDCWRETLGNDPDQFYGTFTLTEGWGYVAIVAAVGLALLVLAGQLYRRRQLEYAGDLLAVKWLQPVFMVVFSVTVGTCCYFMSYFLLGTLEGITVMLPLGVAFGWFVGRMLVERQSRVLRSLKNWLGLMALLAVLALTLFGLSLDPFGITEWVPEVEEVKSVTISNGYRGVIETDDPDEIADVIAVHQFILRDKLTEEEVNAVWMEAREAAMERPEVQAGKVGISDMAERIGYRKSANIRIIYTLTNGRTVQRDYYMWLDNEMGELTNRYFSRIQAVFYHNNRIRTGEDLLKLAGTPDYFFLDGIQMPKELLTARNMESFFRAVIADCEAGHMTQDSAYHQGFAVDTDARVQRYLSVDIELANQGLYFSVYADSENCMGWLEENGFLDCLENTSVTK